MSYSSRLPPQSLVEKRDLGVGTLWFDDLSISSKARSKGISLQRSESDPVALLEGSSCFHSPLYFECDGSSTSTTEGSEADCDFKKACAYGPNSPCQNNELTHRGSMIMSAFFKTVSQKPCHYLCECPTGTGVACSDKFSRTCAGLCHPISIKASKRRSRQRSRVRKLQYIAELERAVNAYEVMGAELASSIASMLQQQAIISVENQKLKQLILRVQKQQMIKDGQCRFLKNQVDRLKALYARLQQGKRTSDIQVGPLETFSTATSCQMLDLGKLSLG